MCNRASGTTKCSQSAHRTGLSTTYTTYTISSSFGQSAVARQSSCSKPDRGKECVMSTTTGREVATGTLWMNKRDNIKVYIYIIIVIIVVLLILLLLLLGESTCCCTLWYTRLYSSRTAQYV